MIGKRFAHYEIVEKIGAGGMGEVYRARDTQLDRDVALKVLSGAFAADPERLARFEREAKLLASLNHPNIAAIYSIAREGELTGLALELVEGEDLAQRLLRGALTVDETLDVAGQVATALEAAHEQGIIHRDLKPANIKIAPDGTVKVLDFGLAKAFDTAGDGSGDPSITQSPTIIGGATQAGMILGTAAYMSPEQARGNTLDRRTDIFSFGIVLYEMLTGKRAFDDGTVSDTLASILKEQPDRDALPPDTPPAIRLLVDRCLEKDAKQRLRDIGEARLMVKAVKDGDATASSMFGIAAAASDGPAPVKSSRLRTREIVAWTLAAVAVAVVIFVAKQDRSAPPAAPRTAHRLTVPIEGTADIRYSHNGLRISPDGKRVAYINGKKLFIRQLDTWDPIEVPQSEGCGTPFWSPDGEWLAYYRGKELWKVRPDGTQRTVICTGDDTFPANAGGAWLADDRIVFRGKRDLMMVQATGGDPDTFVSAADTAIVDFHEPSALPGGNGLVTIVHTPEGVNTLGIVTLNGSLKTVITLTGGNLAQPCYSPSGHILVIKDGDLWALRFSPETQEVIGQPFSVASNAAVPSVSSNGTLVYVRGAGQIKRRLVFVDRTGTITDSLGRPGELWPSYALSPDENAAVGNFGSGDEDLYLFDDRQAITRVTFTGIEHDMPSFSPDGTTLYFSTGVEYDYRIGSQLIGRNDPEKILVEAGEMGPHYYASCPVVTSDGTTLFYTAIGANKKQDVAWLDLTKESKPQRFLSGAAGEYGAQPSPADKKYVAYVSDDSGAIQVYMTTWPDASQKLPVSVAGGAWPRWKGDGTELYFARENDIYVVSVTYDPLRLGRPQKLFSRPEQDDRQPFGWPATFGVTSDGQLFLTTELAPDENLNPQIAIIENWAHSVAEQE